MSDRAGMQRPVAAPVTIVTGASGNIGRAIVDELVRLGHRVAGFDAVTAPLEVPLAHSAVVDVVSPVSVREAIGQVVDRLGRLDGLVNCAGIAHRGSFADTTAAEFMADVETNLLGTFLMCQAAVFPHLQAAGKGRIVNVASISGKTGGTGPVHSDGAGGRSGPGYASAKAGVINLTRWIAREVGRWDITCNVVAPGPIRGRLTAGHAYDTSDIPMGRMGEPADVASAVAWLLSDGAGYVSGTVVDVDGGLVRA